MSPGGTTSNRNPHDKQQEPKKMPLGPPTGKVPELKLGYKISFFKDKIKKNLFC